MISSHTKWFKNGSWDSDKLPDARTSRKIRTLIRPMTIWMGRHIACDRPLFTEKAFGRAIPASKSWKHVLHNILRCLVIFTDAQVLFMLPKCLGNLSLMPCWECSASLLGTCLSRSGNLNRWFGMLWAPLNGWGLAWDTKHSVASSWKKCYFRQSWNYFIFTKGVWSPELISALLKGNPPLTGCLCHLFSSL